MNIVILYEGQHFQMILKFTDLPFCINTEEITTSPTVTDVTYLIVPKDAKTDQAESLNMISVANMHSSILLMIAISLTIQL